jgi:hypothetical protein
MPTGARAPRVLLFSVSCLFVVVSAASEDRPPAADKSAQSASAPASYKRPAESADVCLSTHGKCDHGTVDKIGNHPRTS